MKELRGDLSNENKNTPTIPIHPTSLEIWNTLNEFWKEIIVDGNNSVRFISKQIITSYNL